MRISNVIVAKVAMFTVYGWKCSYFTGKLKAYMQYKNIPYKWKPMNIFDFYKAKKKFGVTVMPYIETPEKVLIQDTRDIIHELERRFPGDSTNGANDTDNNDQIPGNSSIFPSTPCKLFVSNLLETWFDEYWVPMAMYYRWNFHENEVFFRDEATRNLLPIPVPASMPIPKFIQNLFTNQTVSMLKSFLPHVGVMPKQFDMIESWTEHVLTLLDTHFEKHPYLLGATPTVGDFSLAGPLIPHLARDPYPKQHLLTKEKYPSVHRWINDISTKTYLDISVPTCKNEPIDDSIPDTLRPILSIILTEFVPMTQAMLPCIEEIRQNPKFYNTATNSSTHKTLPRRLDVVGFPFHDFTNTDDKDTPNNVFERNVNPFVLYKVQCVLDCFNDMRIEEQQQVRKFLDSIINIDASTGTSNASGALLDLKIPRLVRKSVYVVFE